jgi:putative flippase GtrA
VTRDTLHRGPRYACVGIACALFNNFLFIGMDAADIHYGVAVIFSTLIMIPLSYCLQRYFTFSVPADWRAFGRYASVFIVNMPLSWFLLFIIHDLGSIPMIWAAPILTVVMFVWNFVASSWAMKRKAEVPCAA